MTTDAVNAQAEKAHSACGNHGGAPTSSLCSTAQVPPAAIAAPRLPRLEAAVVAAHRHRPPLWEPEVRPMGAGLAEPAEPGGRAQRLWWKSFDTARSAVA